MVVGSSKTTPNVFVVQNLDFKSEIFLHVLDNHDQVGQLDSQSFARVGRASDVGGAHIGPDYLEDEALDIRIRDPLDVAVADLLVPDLQGFAPYAVQDGQKTALKCVLKHC